MSVTETEEQRLVVEAAYEQAFLAYERTQVERHQMHVAYLEAFYADRKASTWETRIAKLRAQEDRNRALSAEEYAWFYYAEAREAYLSAWRAKQSASPQAPGELVAER